MFAKIQFCVTQIENLLFGSVENFCEGRPQTARPHIPVSLSSCGHTNYVAARPPDERHWRSGGRAASSVARVITF